MDPVVSPLHPWVEKGLDFIVSKYCSGSLLEYEEFLGEAVMPLIELIPSWSASGNSALWCPKSF